MVEFLEDAEPAQELFLFRCPTCRRELALLPRGYRIAQKANLVAVCGDCVEKDERYAHRLGAGG